MRTRTEIQLEAHRLEARAGAMRRESLGFGADATLGASSTIPLFTIPESSVRLSRP